MIRFALPLLLITTQVLAETQLDTRQYTCDRGVTVPVAYINADDTSLAVLNVEGRQIVLYSEETASGARYAWPSDGSGYVWVSKGNTAMLIWKDGASKTETPLLATCTVLQ